MQVTLRQFAVMLVCLLLILLAVLCAGMLVAGIPLAEILVMLKVAAITPLVFFLLVLASVKFLPSVREARRTAERMGVKGVHTRL